jgi:hypothetical protein
MSYDTIHTETYKHKNGKEYLVEVEPDYHYDPPEENSDGHGPVVEMDFDPHDEGSVDEWVYENLEEDSPRELEERARLSMMQVLGRFGRSYDSTKYYDVWEALKIAKKCWGCTTDEQAQAAVDRDFEYLDGWYCDDWHWVSVAVYALDEDGEKDEESCSCVCGFASTIIEQREYFVATIEELIADMEYTRRKLRHKGQLELPL